MTHFASPANKRKWHWPFCTFLLKPEVCLHLIMEIALHLEAHPEVRSEASSRLGNSGYVFILSYKDFARRSVHKLIDLFHISLDSLTNPYFIPSLMFS